MKIIHCADIHLDSRMETHFDSATAKKRKMELLDTFRSMIRYAADNDVSAVIIAGDLFDTDKVSALTRSSVMESIRENSRIRFYYLRGNHDLGSRDEENSPENLYSFTDSWTAYSLADGVVLSGVELDRDNSASIYDSLRLNEADFNMVVLHGQEAMASSKDRHEVINLRALRNRGIDYLALGHVHSYKKEALDSRGQYCYPGCLEGRGFDECGIHGFVLLDIDVPARKYEARFVPFAERTLYEVDVDVSDCTNENEIEELIWKEIRSGRYPAYERQLFKVNLVGAVDVNCEKDAEYLSSRIGKQVFFAKVKDKTEAKIYYEDYLQEESLKGAFVRSVVADEALTEEDRGRIIRIGIRLIDGKEID